MNPRIFKSGLILAMTFVACMLIGCAENEPAAPDIETQPIETSLLAGPTENEILSFNSTATFTWDGIISPGYINSFTYTFMEVVDDTTLDTLYTNTALEKTYSATGLQTADYRFTVFAHADQGDTVCIDDTPVIRNFAVDAADDMAPVVQMLRAPKQNSYAATGANVFFEWSATDPSSAGSIATFEYALADSSVPVAELEWSDPRAETTQKSYSQLANGTYRFHVRATDISGLAGTASSDFVVKTPDILFVIDRGLTTADIEFWHNYVLRDFAYEDHVLSVDPAEFIASIDINTYSSIVWAGNDDTSILPGGEFARLDSIGTVAEALNNYVNAGGHLWISGGEILYDLGGNTWPGLTYDDGTFIKEVLHIMASDEGSNNFQGGISTGLEGYNSIIVDGNATFTWCDRVDPIPGESETILTFDTPDLDFQGQSAAVRYPAGADEPGETMVVYFGFYLSTSDNLAAVKTSDIYDLATTIFTDFGENED